MTSERPNEAAIFNAARNIESLDERNAFLQNACGNDDALRERIDKLLAAFTEESQFLEQPAPGLQQHSSPPLRGEGLEKTVIPDAADKNFAASLNAGLAATFGEESAVVVGNTNHSVLKSMSASLTEVPRVSLREPKEAGDEPIQRPSSPEIPNQPSDSRYRLDGEIARGGMGAVLRGRDTDLGRDLAVKVLLDVHKNKPEVVQRFIEEAQIGGQLQHPGIAPVYELGQFSDQRPFFSMKLVKGDTLSKLLSDRDDPTSDRSKLIGIFEQVCQTMAYAHSRGVIHRDLKPANIMVGAFGEVQVMDWGLAKVLAAGGVADEKAARKKQNGETMIQTMRSVGSDGPGTVGSVGSETQMGSVMGTPAYMPPEQALGEIDLLDQRADVFGLGAILAEILTGQPPYVADDGTQIYRMASRGKLGDCFTRLDECGADPELILLAKQCLELEPADRPKDANALAEDVTGYLESVETKLRTAEVERAGEAARVVEQRKRFRVTVGLAAAALSILLAGIGATAWQAREAKRQTRVARVSEQKAVEAKTAAEDARDEAYKAREAVAKAKQQQEQLAKQRRRELYAADMQLADQLYNGQNGEQKRIQQILASWIPVDDQEDLREFSWRYQWTRLHNGASVNVPNCKGVAITPDNKMVVADNDGLHEVDDNGQKSKLIDWNLKYPWPWFSPDGRWVASKFESGVELYNIKSGKKVLSLPQTRASFSANGDYFAAWKGGAKVDSQAEGENRIPVWKLENENAIRIEPLVPSDNSNLLGDLSRLPEFANDFKLGSDGKSMLRRVDDKVVAWLDGNPEPVFWFHRDTANCAWSPDEKIIASTSSGTIELRLSSEVAQKRTLEKLTFSSHGKHIQTLRFSPDGSVLATGGNDGTIDLWDVSAVVTSLERIDFSEQKRTDENASNLASINTLPKPRLIRTIKAFTDKISNLDTALSFSHDGSLLAALDSSGNVKRWDLQNVTGKYQIDQVTDDLYGWRPPIFGKLEDEGFLTHLDRLLPDEIVEGSPEFGERIVAVFDPEKGDWLIRDGMETWYDFSILMCGSRGSKVRLRLESAEGERHEVTLRRERQMLNQSPRSFSVAFAPDGNSVVVGDYTIGATRLNLSSREAIRYPQSGMSAAFSPDGRLVALDSALGISIRDVETDKELYQLDSLIDSGWNPNTFGGNLAFSPDGKYLAHVSGYRYNNQRSDLNVWRTSDFKKVSDAPLRQKDIAMAALAFSPDSSRLFVGDYAGVVEVWNTSDWTVEASIETAADKISSLVISSDGKRLVTGSYQDFIVGGSVGVWDVQSKEAIHVLGSSSSPVSHLALSPDDRTLAVGRMDHNVVLWDIETGKPLQTIQAHSDSIFGVAFSHDGNRLATLSTDGVLHVWDAATCPEIENDPKTVDLLFAIGSTRWRQQRFLEGEKTTALALKLNRKSGHLSENEVADSARYVRRMMKTLGYWPLLKEETGNWPSFTKQPPKTFATKLGEHVNLSAEVTEGDWSYQWSHNGDPIDGANSPSLELENVSKAELGIYRLEVLGEDLKPLYQKKCFATIFLVNEREKVMKGHLLREVFLDLRFGTLKSLEANSRFLNNQSDFIGVIDCWETPTNFSHFYGQRVSGFVVPPKTGDYVFYLASDDESELFLSSDESEENYQRIARVKQEMKEDATAVGYMQPRAWGDHPNSVSAPIHLEAGKRYAIKGIMAEGNFGDHFAVTWQMPGDPPPKPGDPPIPGEYLEFEVK